MSKKRRKKKVIMLALIVLLIIGVILYVILFKFGNVGSSSSKALAEIKEYGYKIEKRDTDLIKNTFYNLKDVLSKDEIDYEKYSEYISTLFIADFYTLDNKNNKYDIGGADYIYSEKQDNFKLKAVETIYKYVEDKDSRKQKLPEVVSVEVSNIKEDTFEYNEKKYDAYSLDVKWEYKKDLGYDTKGSIILIKDDNKLSIASFTPEVSK